MKTTKGQGMSCRCKAGKRCRYNKVQWKVARKAVFKKMRITEAPLSQIEEECDD